MEKLDGLLRKLHVRMHLLIAFMIASIVAFCFAGEKYLNINPIVVGLTYLLSFLAFVLYSNVYSEIRDICRSEGLRMAVTHARISILPSAVNGLTIVGLTVYASCVDKIPTLVFALIIIATAIFILMSRASASVMTRSNIVAIRKTLQGNIIEVLKFETCRIYDLNRRKIISRNGIHDVTGCELVICRSKDDEGKFDAEFEYDSNNYPDISYEAYKAIRKAAKK